MPTIEAARRGAIPVDRCFHFRQYRPLVDGGRAEFGLINSALPIHRSRRCENPFNIAQAMRAAASRSARRLEALSPSITPRRSASDRFWLSLRLASILVMLSCTPTMAFSILSM